MCTSIPTNKNADDDSSPFYIKEAKLAMTNTYKETCWVSSSNNRQEPAFQKKAHMDSPVFFGDAILNSSFKTYGFYS